MKTFECDVAIEIETKNRESTVQSGRVSLPGAIAKAAREFVKGLTASRDSIMNKSGLRNRRQVYRHGN